MIDLAAAMSAGLGAALALLALSLPEPEVALIAWVKHAARRWWVAEQALASAAGWAWLDGRTLVALEFVAASAGALFGIPVVEVDSYQSNVRNLRDQLKKLRDDHPEAV